MFYWIIRRVEWENEKQPMYLKLIRYKKRVQVVPVYFVIDNNCEVWLFLLVN